MRQYHQDCSPQNEDSIIEKLLTPVNSQKLQILFTDFLGTGPESILDIGCGTGRFLRSLPESWQKVGLEKRPDVVEIARLLAYGRTQIYDGIAEALPFESSKFDIVTSFQIIEHVKEPDLAISEMFRVTKPGGVVYGELQNKWYPRESHINLIYPQLLPMWLRKPYIDHFAKLNVASKECDYLRNIHYVTPQQIISMLENYVSRVVHLSPIRLEQRFKVPYIKPFAKVLSQLGAKLAGIDFLAIK